MPLKTLKDIETQRGARIFDDEVSIQFIIAFLLGDLESNQN